MTLTNQFPSQRFQFVPSLAWHSCTRISINGLREPQKPIQAQKWFLFGHVLYIVWFFFFWSKNELKLINVFIEEGGFLQSAMSNVRAVLHSLKLNLLCSRIWRINSFSKGGTQSSHCKDTSAASHNCLFAQLCTFEMLFSPITLLSNNIE